MTTRPDMEAIQARLAAATPGEWTLNPYGDDGELGAGDVYAVGGPLIGHDVMGVDAAFITAAHNTDMPDLLAYVETLEDAMRSALRSLDSEYIEEGVRDAGHGLREALGLTGSE